VLDARHIEIGTLDPAAWPQAHRGEEARLLARDIEKVLRLGDVDLITDESSAKALLGDLLRHETS